MRIIFIVAAFFLTSLGYTQDRTLCVSSNNKKIQLDIRAEIDEGQIVVDRLEMRRPQGVAPGFLSLSLKSGFASDPAHKECKTIFFNRGEDLPSLSDGVYDLFINGMYYGQLFVDSDCVEVHP